MTSNEFLEIALSRAPTPSEIDELLTNRVNEDLWLEYKRGGWLEHKEAKRQRNLRQYVAGFANADSGVVLLGVAGGEKPEQPTDKQWAVDGCPTHSQPWDEWASNSLSPLSGYLSRQPRIYLVHHSAGEVLVVAVQRSNGLVPCVEGGSPLHYMRIGHQTLRLDPYLYADLVIGRRQTPHCKIELQEPKVEQYGTGTTIHLSINFIVRNESLVWIPGLQIGIIGIGRTDPRSPSTMICEDGGRGVEPTQGEPLPQALSAHVKVLASDELPVEPLLIRSLPRPVLTAAPFASIMCSATFSLPTMDVHRFPCRWQGAIYVAPTNSLPQWFAVQVMYYPMPAPYMANVKEYKAVPIDDELVPIYWGDRATAYATAR